MVDKLFFNVSFGVWENNWEVFPTSYFLKELSSAGVTLEGRVSSVVEAAPRVSDTVSCHADPFDKGQRTG